MLGCKQVNVFFIKRKVKLSVNITLTSKRLKKLLTKTNNHFFIKHIPPRDKAFANIDQTRTHIAVINKASFV